MPSSREINDAQFLGQRQTERLLTDWANIPDLHAQKRQDGIVKLIRHYPELFPPMNRSAGAVQVGTVPIPYPHWAFVLDVQEYLTKAWNTSDPRHRDWCIFKVRDQYRFGVSKISEGQSPSFPDRQGPDEPPPLSPLERAMTHFQRNSDRARHCLNPECPAPYFFAPPKKKGQKYCSEKCAGVGTRESKKRWWNENRGKGTNTPKGQQPVKRPKKQKPRKGGK